MAMLIRGRNWTLPLYAPAGEGGTDGGADTGADTGGAVDQGAAGGDEGDSKSPLRQQLEKNVDALRQGADAGADDKRGKGKGVQSTARREGLVGDGTGADDKTADKGGAAAAEMPKAFGGDLGQTWAQVPPAWQQAIAKREADMAKGVEELKGRYSQLDQAIAPHMDAIRANNKTPAEAVNQLFAWFQALAANPDVAFPALAKSFKYDLARIGVKVDGQQVDGKAAQKDGKQPDGEIPPAVQAYIDNMKNELASAQQKLAEQFGGLASNFQRETQQKTEELLGQWSKDKPHFEAVRGDMAHLIQSGIVPLKDGKVDLDGAYERAIWANPEIRAKVLAEQEAAKAKAAADKAAADKKAQQDAADKARRAGVSLTGGAPGAPTTAPMNKRGKGKSVRDSINDAIESVRS